MPQYSDSFKARVIADYVLLGSLRAAARKNGVSPHTVKRWCAEDADVERKCTQKKAEAEADVLDYIGSLAPRLCALVDALVAEMSDPEKLAKAKPGELATVYGIIVDKCLASKKAQAASGSQLPDMELDPLSAALAPEDNEC